MAEPGVVYAAGGRRWADLSLKGAGVEDLKVPGVGSTTIVAAGAGQVKRAKFIVPYEALGRLLGLPAEVRVVGLVAPGDPAHLHVLVEGAGVPETRSWPGMAACHEVLAAIGHGGAPILWHPASGTTARIRWGSWVPGDPQPEPGTVFDVEVTDGE